jgi:hypothetical protein
MRKLHNVRKMTATNAPATNAPATNAPATNENANIELANDLMLFVGLALDYNQHKSAMLGVKMAMMPYIERYRASGYTSISAGAKGRSKSIPTPADNELPYTLVVASFDAMCSKRGIAYDNTTKLSGGKTQWQNAKNQFLASFKLALTNGEWDNNVSRANETTEPTDTAEPKVKVKVKRNPNTDKTIDVAKIAESLNNKLSRDQTLDLMDLLCDAISDKNTTYVISKH